MASDSKRKRSSIAADDIGAVPSTHSRDLEENVNKRVFVNRGLNMSKIRYIGFDMDYTLAVYKSPQFEELGFQLTRQRLVDIGYPAPILDFEYDPSFCARGLWFDNKYGNLLKVDSFGNLLVAIHGFHFLTASEIKTLYPNSFVKYEEDRMSILNTLFALPETYILACVVQYFMDEEDYLVMPEGVKKGDLYMPWTSIHTDIRESVDWVHIKGSLKTETVVNFEKYIEKDSRLPILLTRLREGGVQTFLLTNSPFDYTDAVMKYLLESGDQGSSVSWKSYFDYVIVDAKKPRFFSSGTVLRQVDEKTGSLRLGVHTGRMEKHAVYAGGSSDVFSEMVGSRGTDVMYVGDHIFGDILKSKRERGWRTFLVVPELTKELNVWTSKSSLFQKLQQLDSMLSDLYKDLDSCAKESPPKPNVRKLQDTIRETSFEMDQCYGKSGSLFRSGSRMTFFASQVMRYADLYSSTFLNLLHYPLCFMFRAPPMLMAHESTVDRATETQTSSLPAISHHLPVARQETTLLHQTRPVSPDTKSHFFDGDDDDDGSESSEEGSRSDTNNRA